MPYFSRGTVYGFEKEDVEQEKALGVLMAGKCQPGNIRAAESRAKVRVARHRKKERAWNSLRVTILEHDRAVSDEVKMNQIYLHEILDLMPYMRKEVMAILEEGDERKINRVGRFIREFLAKRKGSTPTP